MKEEDKDPSDKKSAPRKVKFAPKVPTQRAPKPPEPKAETLPEVEAEAAQMTEVLRHVNERSRRQMPKVDKKSAPPMQVAFGNTGGSTSIRSHGENSRSKAQRVSASDGVTSDGPTSTAPNEMKKEKKYVEPWDYGSNYPVTLPMRRPNLGDPELLDEEEFGEGSASAEYDETTINPAEELGLTKKSGETDMFFLQLPVSLPFVKRPASAMGKETSGSSSSPPSQNIASPGKGLNELPQGYLGKMLVYKSGAIKLKLGEILYDVSPGTNCAFPQDVAAINTKEKSCYVLGKLKKRAIITPDIDSLLSSSINLG